MNNRTKLTLKRLIRETIRDLREQKNEVFGKYAFAPERQKRKINITPHEENTPIEQYTFYELTRHKEDEWGRIPPDVLKVLMNIQNQNLYNDVFPGVADKQIYRGMNVDESFIKNFTDKNPEDLYYEWLENTSKDTVIEGDWVFNMKPGRTADSWTTNFEIADNFSSMGRLTKNNQAYSFSLVLQGSMLDNKGVMIDLSKFEEMFSKHDEDEVLAVGPVKFNKVYVTYAMKKRNY